MERFGASASRSYVFVAALLVLLAEVSVGVLTYENCRTLDTVNGNFRLRWNVTSTTLYAAYEAPAASGWMAVGLSDAAAHAMISDGRGSEIFLARRNANGTARLDTYWAQAYEAPRLLPASEQLASLVSVTSEAGSSWATVAFSRSLSVANATYHRNINVTSPVGFIWAFNPEPNSVSIAADGTARIVKHLADTRGSALVNLLQPSVCQAPPSSPPPGTGSPFEFSAGSGGYNVKWTYDVESIKFEVSAQTSGWVAVGISNTGTMPGSDMIVGWVSPSGTVTVGDRFSTANGMPPLDTAQNCANDLTSVSGSLVIAQDGTPTTTIRFSRPLISGDKCDIAIANSGDGKEATPQWLLWAYGADGSVDYASGTFAQHAARGAVRANFYTGEIDSTQTINLLAKAHGTLMLAGWLVCMVFGQMLARYFKLLLPTWFRHHVWIQMLGVVLVLAAFVSILVHVGGFRGGPHQVFGMLILIGMLATPVLGWISHLKFDPQRVQVPIWPDKVHWWTGRLVTAAALVNIVLGLKELTPNGAPLVVYLVWLAVLALPIIFMEFRAGQSHEAAGRGFERLSGDGGAAEVELSADVTDAVPDAKPSSVSKPLSRRMQFTVLGAVVAVQIAFFVAQAVMIGADVGPQIVVEIPPAGPPFESNQEHLRFESFSVPTNETSYYCRSFKFPIDRPYHLTKFVPVIDSKVVVHHMILFAAAQYQGDGYFDCTDMPNDVVPLFIWAVGMSVFEPPSNVGFRVGNGSWAFATLQIHYDNPSGIANLLDSSGVQIVMTPKLRPIDAGFFAVGSRISQLNVPPGEAHYQVETVCSRTNRFPPASAVNPLTPEYRIFGYALHAHTIGRQIWTEQYRNDSNGNLAPLGNAGCNRFYDFNQQQIAPINATMVPGDVFKTYCVFDSTSRTNVTRGCEGTQCEMCLNFFAYYPAVPSQSFCLSSPTPVLSGRSAPC